jgi:1-acyl-sn-glycerol-3-phosphate acyltransferase
MIRVRQICFQFLFFVWNLVLAVLALPVLIMPRPVLLRFVRFYLAGAAWLFKHVAGTDFRLVGQAHIPAEPCIIAAKHLSFWETIILPLLMRSPAIVLKQELMRIPLWGWYAARYGNVPVDRGGRARAMIKMLTAARRVLHEQRDLLIFPQGTRLSLGEWRPYKVGVAGLYQELGLPILPVALNSGVFWSRSGKLLRTGEITLEFLPVIPAGLERAEMLAQLEERVETATNRLVQAEGGPAARKPDLTKTLLSEVA